MCGAFFAMARWQKKNNKQIQRRAMLIYPISNGFLYISLLLSLRFFYSLWIFAFFPRFRLIVAAKVSWFLDGVPLSNTNSIWTNDTSDEVSMLSVELDMLVCSLFSRLFLGRIDSINNNTFPIRS